MVVDPDGVVPDPTSKKKPDMTVKIIIRIRPFGKKLIQIRPSKNTGIRYLACSNALIVLSTYHVCLIKQQLLNLFSNQLFTPTTGSSVLLIVMVSLTLTPMGGGGERINNSPCYGFWPWFLLKILDFFPTFCCRCPDKEKSQKFSFTTFQRTFVFGW